MEKILNLLHNNLPLLSFYSLASIIVLSAICVAVMKNIVRCALFLALSFVGVAGIYILLNAEFLAVIQILIYVGAITVLIIFAIMLSQKIVGQQIVHTNSQSIPAFIVTIGIFCIITDIIVHSGLHKGIHHIVPFGTIENIGKLLLKTYVIPFEVASLVLLVAMLGAIIIARKD